MNESILLVEDDKDTNTLIRQMLTKSGFKVLPAYTGKEAVTLFGARRVDCVILDFKLPDMTGMDVLGAITKTGSSTPVIFVTGHADVRTAVEAIKKGAFDFLAKPIEYAALEVVLGQALKMASMRRELDVMRRQTQGTAQATLLGESAAMRTLLRTLDKVAQSPAGTVLITGETGTGKELAARAVHNRSGRREKPFVVVNCTVLHEQLLESELFGHERGAFTDAKESKKGLLEIADGGSLMLDEIGDMDFKLQSKILRVLETGNFRRLGGTQEIDVDVRMIAATNKNLEEQIRKGAFREDLYYRLQVVPVRMPALREHKEDILLLARYFLSYYAFETRKEAPALSARAEGALMAYDWPGNVRELRNLMERLVILGGGETIDLADLPDGIKGGGGGGTTAERPVAADCSVVFKEAKQRAVIAFEKSYLESLMRRNEGNISRSAGEAGIDRRNFQRLLKKYNIVSEAFRADDRT